MGSNHSVETMITVGSMAKLDQTFLAKQKQVARIPTVNNSRLGSLYSFIYYG